MNPIKRILKNTVIESIRVSMFHKIKDLQKKITELNLQKALMKREYQQLIYRYEDNKEELIQSDSADGSQCGIISNRAQTLRALDQIDHELREIEASLEMIELMKEEIQYEIMMMRRLNEKEVST